MRIQPRQRLLDVWRAVARCSYQDGLWIWGPPERRNSISDAEHLLCLLGPATEIPTFRLDRPDETAEDVLEMLDAIGDSVEIPRVLIRAIRDYFRTYTDDNGTPLFSGGSYFDTSGDDPPSEAQRALDVVDSFSASIRLCLATIGFAKVFRTVVSRETLRREVDELETMASQRLTAAMLGLLRSFAVNTFDVNSPYGRNLCEMVLGEEPTPRHLVEELQSELREVKAGLRDLTVGIGQVSELDNENKLFECGWSWGVIKDAPEVRTTAYTGKQRDGVAAALPFLYFTVVALDSIQDLFSERTRILGLLGDEQQGLARALQIRWDLTQSYWSKIARFGRESWPLESLPWRTTDGVESDYLSLLVTSIVVQELANRHAPESDVGRVGEVLRELAGRARITRRPTHRDPALALHAPGFPVGLDGSEALGDGQLRWLLADFAPQLLRRTIRVAGLLATADRRTPIVGLVDRIWEDHLRRRRLLDGPAAALWDQPGNVFPELTSIVDGPSWYHTERVVACLVDAAGFVASPPLRSPALAELAADLLAEADHLFDQELLSVSAEEGPAMGMALQKVRASLRRAHDSLSERPGTAAVLAWDVLRELDRLVSARQQAVRAG